MVSGLDEVEEFGHFSIGELDATAAGGLADFVFVVGAVNVDVALKAIASVALIDSRFETFEPEDASGDEIGALLLVAQLFIAAVDADSALENFAESGSFADLLGDSVKAGRSAHGILEIGRRLEASGNAVRADGGIVFEQFESLVGDRYEQSSR